MAGELRIADDLAIPIDAVTETFLIFGKRGSGKTATSVVLTEEMIGAGLPVCVLDPMGAWWGLRSSADGQGPGLPVTILGGEHADLPLSHDSGTAVADLLVAERMPLVLDMFAMSKTQQRTFVTDFMERLFRKNRDPLHLVIDEADRFAPQRGDHDGARLLGAYEDIVLRGRKPGIGSTSITLRPAQLHSAIRSQVEVLIAMKLLGKLDVQAIDEWVRLHATEAEARELKASLPSLPVGTGWFWSPGWLEIMAKVHVRARRTFDSSATPRVGQQRIVPREFAPVNPADLERLRDRLGATATAETPVKATGDVKRLGAEVARLRAQLAEAAQREPERIEVPVVAPGDVAAFEQAITALRDIAGSLELALSRATAPARVQPDAPKPAPKPAPRPSTPPPAIPALESPADAAVRPLKAGERNMLAMLARMRPMILTRAQLGALTGFAASGSTFKTYLNVLRRHGLVELVDDGIEITPPGLAVTGAELGQPATTAEIREIWSGALKAGERAMLDALIDAYPSPVSRPDLGALAGFDAGGSTFKTYVNVLKRNMLAEETPDGICAADVFFLVGANDD